MVYFDAVVRNGGFTRASESVHVAQPAISAQIRRLEREMGIELLRRTTRSVELTAVGHAFLAHVRAVLVHLDEARAEIATHRGIDSGHVRIGATSVAGDLDLVGVLGQFRTRYPGVALSLRAGLIDSLIQALTKDELDVVIGPFRDGGGSSLDVVPVAGEDLVLITSVADSRRITAIADVAADRFVCLAASSGLRRLLQQAFEGTGVSPQVDFETHSPASIRDLVGAGLGSAVLAKSAATGPGAPIKVHRLADLPQHPPICVFSIHDRATEPTQRLIAELISAANPPPMAPHPL